LVIKILDPDPDPDRYSAQNAGSVSVSNEYGTAKHWHFYGIGFKGWLFCLEDRRLLLKLKNLHGCPRRKTKNFYIGAGRFGMVPYPQYK
jgi:hypothetical protein